MGSWCLVSAEWGMALCAWRIMAGLWITSGSLSTHSSQRIEACQVLQLSQTDPFVKHFNRGKKKSAYLVSSIAILPWSHQMCLMAFHLACVIRPGGLTTEVSDSKDRQMLKLAGESYFNIVFLSPYNSPVNRALSACYRHCYLPGLCSWWVS